MPLGREDRHRMPADRYPVSSRGPGSRLSAARQPPQRRPGGCRGRGWKPDNDRRACGAGPRGPVACCLHLVTEPALRIGNSGNCYRTPRAARSAIEQWRRGVSIGDALAEARRQAGLTITQVSQRTCIRETIIRGIERGDYSACGGDFYARGHIRSIARAVGADPDSLVREYDSAHGTPQAINAADVFEPATPIRIKERRRPNWSLAMILVLAVI